MPQVMQAEKPHGQKWIDTPSHGHMEEIDELFKETTSNEQKNRRTNELLGAFALCHKAKKLGNRFSAQRRWMTRVYEKRLDTIEQKRGFLRNLASVATFYREAWYMEEVDTLHHIRGLDDHPQGALGSFLVQYLKSANSKLSAPILAWFYSHTLARRERVGEFIEASKACAAFFTLWRSANSTSGLDNAYRLFFKGNNWTATPDRVSSEFLKTYFIEALNKKGITSKDAWVKASTRFLLYTEVKALCRFVLFLASHDRVPDDANPGLTAKGNKGVCRLLELSRWVQKDCKTLEHIAPQNPRSGHQWDPRIYSENKVHDIGNLLLLPRDINSLVDNRRWPVKFLHYSHVGARSQNKITELRKAAKNNDIQLRRKAINALTRASYNCAVEPILTVGINGPWDARMIDRRTNHIKEIAWDILTRWLKV